MANTYLQEAFKQLDILNEEDFNLSDKDSFNDLQEFDDDEQMVIDIIDDEASSEEELEDSYIGDVILDCEVCHSKIYKDASEVTVNEETNLANEGEECPFCYSSDGFKVIGQVAPYGEVDEEEIESKDEEEIEDSIEEDEEKEEVKESICNCRKHRKTINEGARKVLKESLGDYEELVDDLADRAKSIFDGMEHGADIQEEMFTAIYQAVDDGLIYYDDQWTVLKHYFNASDLLFSEKNYGAIERLYDDVMDNLETMLDAPIGESLKKESLKESMSATKDTIVKDWYKSAYPTDDLGDELYDFVTFDMIYKYPANVYEMTCSDSVIRERIFNELCNIYGCEYDDIYRRWLYEEPLSIDELNKAFNLIEESLDRTSLKEGFWKHFEADAQYPEEWCLLNTPNDTTAEFNIVLNNGKYVLSRYGRRVDTYNTLEDAQSQVTQMLGEAIAPKDNPNHKEGRPYWYFTTHGVQPGSVPRGIEIEEIRDDEHGHGTYFSTYHLLTTQELEDYDIKERRPMDESIEGAIVETEDEVMEMSTNEEGGITINTTPKQEEPEMGEMIAPLEPEVEEEIKDASEEEMEEPNDDETDIDMEEIDEESFDELGESFLKKAYENVNSFKTSRVTEKGNTLVVEGVINFKSGKTKKTTFIFEAKDVTKNGTMRFIGENKELSRGKKSFTLRGKMDGAKFIAESLGYNYRAKLEEGKSTRVYGTVRLNEAQKGNNGSERKDIFDKVVFELQSEDEGELPRKVKSKKADRYSQDEIGTDSENVIVTADNFEHARKVAKAFGLKTKETKRQITIYIPQKGLTNHYSEAGGKKAPTKKKRTVIQGKKITPAVNK